MACDYIRLSYIVLSGTAQHICEDKIFTFDCIQSYILLNRQFG